MRIFTILGASALALAAAALPASADVQLQIQNGRVTLLAKDATLRQIFTEWARVGQTKIVNAERIPGGPLTLELRDVSEQQALKVLLRSVSGYVTAQRETLTANGSIFDRIVVMPTIATAPAPSSAALAPPPFATFQPPQQQATPDDDDSDDKPAPAAPQPANRGPVFAFPPAGGGQPQPVNPPAPFPGQAGAAVPPPAAAFPGAPTAAPLGVSTPGMVVPAPQPPPGQPAQPGQPAAPRQP